MEMPRVFKVRSKTHVHHEQEIPMGLTDLIAVVQRELPDFLTLTVCGNAYEQEWLHVKINNIYVPLDYDDEPTAKINDLMDVLHNYTNYTFGDGIFKKAKAFTNKNYFKVHLDLLAEISRNIGQTPVILFISKSEWYVDVPGSGPFYPLKKVLASEFINYLNRLDNMGVLE